VSPTSTCAEDGTPSARSELFVETVALIRERSEIVTMVSTGGAVWMSMEERMAGLEAEPDMAGVETGSMNFGEEPFITIPADARRVVERTGELGVALEAEMFDVGHVLQGVRMLERGELPLPLLPTSSSASPVASTPRRRLSTRCCGRFRPERTGR
jgi:3-keto-5-aminohexanoate cleavage enzyme